MTTSIKKVDMWPFPVKFYPISQIEIIYSKPLECCSNPFRYNDGVSNVPNDNMLLASYRTLHTK